MLHKKTCTIPVQNKGQSMAITWIKVGRGIRYREHPTRRHGTKLDRYYTIYYSIKSKDFSEGIGWSSDGVRQETCEKILITLRSNHKSGLGAKTYKEVRQANIDTTEAEKIQNQHEQSLTLKGIFEGAYLDAQLAKSEKSLQAEKQIMKNHVIPFFKDMPLRDISPSTMDNFLSHILKKKSERTGRLLSSASVRYILATIRQLWNYALSRELIDTPYPAQRIKPPQADNRRTRFLTREEAEQLLNTLLMRSQDTHDIALLSLFCGLRASELFKLQWADVNFSESLIYIRDRKNKESGIAYMTPRIKKMIEKRFQNQNANAPVFPTVQGKNKQFTSKLFSRVVDELGFNNDITDARQKIVFHSLRHTYASWLAQKGVPLHTLAGLLGHKSTTMTERYSHLSPEGLKASAMLIDEPQRKGKVIPFSQVEGA